VKRLFPRRPRLASLGAAVVLAALAACQRSDSAPVAARGPVTPIDPSTASSIQVQVSYNGPVPAPEEVNMGGTPACAALHPQPVLEQNPAVADGRLADAVVYIVSGLGDRAFATPSTPVVVDQKGCLYAPHVVGVMVGQPLQFRNSDQEAHNVHGRPKQVDAWNFLMSRPNSTRDVTFDRPEVGIPVSCDVHPWMRAFVSVFDNPYFAVTPSNGSVTLALVPPGHYVVGVWHERLGTMVQPVTLEPSSTAKVSFVYQPAQG